jgi:hypothetical protein
MQELEFPPPSSGDVIRRESYKKLVYNACMRLMKLDERLTDWNLMSPSVVAPKALLQYRHKHDDAICKTECTLPHSAERVFKMCSDTSYVTLSQWIPTDMLLGVDQWETFDTSNGDIKLIQLQIDTGVFGANPRNLLGLCWSRYNNANQTYSIVFQTITHNIFKSPASQVTLECTASIWIKRLEAAECFISIIVKSNAAEHTLIPFMNDRVCRMCARYVALIDENIGNEEIYKKWQCVYCTAGKRTMENDAYLLECRQCTLARYWKCMNTACRRSQPKTAVGTCVYCNTARE